MMYTVNLLPWRRQRQRRCALLWGVVFSATLLIVLLAALSQRYALHAGLRSLSIARQADGALLTQLKRREIEWQVQQQRIQHLLARQQQRFSTRDWQQILTSLAKAMPPACWLTLLEYQQGTLRLTGLAATFDAMSLLEDRLKKLAGFQAGKAGGTERDTEGRWKFHFQLTRSSANESLP